MKNIIVLFVVLIGFIVSAQEKVYLGEVKNKEYKYYIYPSTIEKVKGTGYITAWSLSEFRKPVKEASGQYYTKLKEKHLIDCVNMKSDIIGLIYYAKNGKIIFEFEYLAEEYPKELIQAIPDTFQWDLLETICKKITEKQ